jgi:tryptophanyl-tRNA synthetase
MSKSSPAGCVFLLDDDKTMVKKIKSAVTDSDREIVFNEATKPGVSNLLTLQSAITGKDIAALVANYEGRGYGDLKGETAEIVQGTLAPIRDRVHELLKDRAELERLIHLGADKARVAAQPTIELVYQRVGFVR